MRVLPLTSHTSKTSSDWGKNTVKGNGPVKPSSTEGSSDSMDIYATQLTISESDNKGNWGNTLPVSVTEPEDDQTLQTRRAELHYNSLHDLARIPMPPTPPLPLAQTVEQENQLATYVVVHRSSDTKEGSKCGFYALVRVYQQQFDAITKQVYTQASESCIVGLHHGPR
uniref:Uncharacterized protein n=1 Tax=Solanum tuberosum TaxID=4113 RepID=M1DW34_SOLTU